MDRRARPVRAETRTRLIVLGLALAVVASAHPAVSAPAARVDAVEAFLQYDRPDTHGIHEQRDVLVPMRDGFTLTCDLTRPAAADGTPERGRFPSLVLNFTGYGRRMYGSGNDLRSFAAKGYNTVWCNTRGAQGTGFSSPAPHSVGQLTPWMPQDQKDNADLISWLAAQPWSTGRIGQIGTSYGGINTLLVAGRQPHPALKAVIPVMGATDMYRHFVYPGGIRTALVGGDARGFWAQACTALTGDATCSRRISDLWASHRTYDRFWKQQTVEPGSIRAATLYVDGLGDFFMPSADLAYEALHQRDDFSVLLGPWGHVVPETTDIEALPTGVYLAWFDRWLRQDARAPRPPKVIAYEMPIAEARPWRGFSAWPPADAEPVRLHLKGDGSLDGPDGQTRSRSYTVGGDGTSGSLSYTTAPFGAARAVTGPVSVTLNASFSANDGNLITYLYDVAPDGTQVALGPAGYLKASHRTSDGAPKPVAPDRIQRYQVRIPSKFWQIAQGHSLRLTVTSADSTAEKDAPEGRVTITTGRSASHVDLHLWTSSPDR